MTLKIAISILILFGAVAAKSADYRRQSATCTISGNHQDIDNPRKDFHHKIQATMNLVYIVETGQVVKNSFSGWIPDPKSPTPLSSVVLNRLNATVFKAFTREYVGYIGQFTLSIPELHGTDLLEILKHLSGQNINPADPFVFSDFAVAEYFSNIYSSWKKESFESPFALDFKTGWKTGKSYEIQIHLPPDVQNGLSFHLKFECSGREQ